MSTVSVRYMIDDVPAAVTFYTTHLGFTLEQDASPAFASVTRDFRIDRRSSLPIGIARRRQLADERHVEDAVNSAKEVSRRGGDWMADGGGNTTVLVSQTRLRLIRG